ncbi:cathepsin L1-like [Tupaia chinensis]|uniref:cathepsin L1-like n=1 Tax=Tupaia chinensis TaxID=246437 RepID=UPI000704283D|nr:cathepsin L1-like [Tupaia chinensis]
MNLLLFLAILFLGMASTAPTLDARLDEQWTQWKAKYKKTYAPNEEEWRRSVWEKNMKIIEQHNLEYNQGKQSFTMEMNAFGDMTEEEFSQMMNGFLKPEAQDRENLAVTTLS